MPRKKHLLGNLKTAFGRVFKTGFISEVFAEGGMITLNLIGVQ